jgi:hypothetical protein
LEIARASHLSVAEAKLAEFLRKHRQRRGNGNGEVSPKMTFGPSRKILPHKTPMCLKLDMNNSADREKLRRAVLDLVAGRKILKQKGYG